jgi:hypothetical protein
VPFDSQADRNDVGSDDNPRHHQLQFDSPVEQDRPIDGHVKVLSRQQRLLSLAESSDDFEGAVSWRGL